MIKRISTQEELKQLVTYDPVTGNFISKVNRGKKVKVGDILGSICPTHGYVYITIDNLKYKAHRLAYLYMTGVMPELVDHKDTIRNNNSWGNLREASPMQNSHNSKAYSTSTTGIKGLSYNNNRAYYSAQVMKNKVLYQEYFHLSNYDTKEQALEAAINWLRTTREALHGEFTNHG